MLDTPILFLIFNRPDATARVFEQIKKVQPKFLFIAADGPRQEMPGEENQCKATKDIVMDRIDWDCEVKTLFRDKNLGCGLAVSGAITWFFEQVEEGIIVEDDCLPDISFFNYCEILLEKYRYNQKIFMISGDNFRFGKLPIKTSYSFSKYCNIWGWATWKRSWNLYAYKIENWPVDSANGLLQELLKNNDEIDYWKKVFDGFYLGNIDTWDYQLLYTCWKNRLLCIEPATNMVMNIGFGENATHLSEPAETLKFGNQKHYPLELYHYPDKIVCDESGDRITFLNRYGDPTIRPFKRKNLIERGKDFYFRITHSF